jgi:hypothetical protein
MLLTIGMSAKECPVCVIHRKGMRHQLGITAPTVAITRSRIRRINKRGGAAFGQEYDACYSSSFGS